VTSERFTGYVNPDGRGITQILLDDRKRWRDAIRRLAGKRFEISLGPEKKDRSLRANRYLWAIYNEIARSCGHDAEEIHVCMKKLFLPPRQIDLGEESVLVPGSTRKLSSVEFAAYVDKVKLWAMEQGLELPDPEHVGEL
jgi:hypothetical protein